MGRGDRFCSTNRVCCHVSPTACCWWLGCPSTTVLVIGDSHTWAPHQGTCRYAGSTVSGSVAPPATGERTVHRASVCRHAAAECPGGADGYDHVSAGHSLADVWQRMADGQGRQHGKTQGCCNPMAVDRVGCLVHRPPSFMPLS
jgi:hypothetical protein